MTADLLENVHYRLAAEYQAHYVQIKVCYRFIKHMWVNYTLKTLRPEKLKEQQRYVVDKCAAISCKRATIIIVRLRDCLDRPPDIISNWPGHCLDEMFSRWTPKNSPYDHLSALITENVCHQL